MDDKVRQFVEKIHKLGRSHELLTGIRGTSNRESMLLDLYKASALMMKNSGNEEQLKLHSDAIRGKLYTAQATGAIGSNDLDRLLDDLDEIEREL